SPDTPAEGVRAPAPARQVTGQGASAMKWIELLKDWMGKKAGERLALAEADAQPLVTAGIARWGEDGPPTPVIARGIESALAGFTCGLDSSINSCALPRPCPSPRALPAGRPLALSAPARRPKAARRASAPPASLIPRALTPASGP